MGGWVRTGSLRQTLLPVLAVGFLLAAGCQRGNELSIPAGAHDIKMVVLKGRGGETLALVPVFINGKGPFAFALDTGASRSVVDTRLAAELGLPISGEESSVSGVGGKATAQPVRVENWRVGNIEIPPSTLDALELSDGDGNTGLQGLLGSDTLSRFQVIQVDYAHQRLIFHPGPSGKLPDTR
jgi:predicted aspartyl protease